MIWFEPPITTKLILLDSLLQEKLREEVKTLATDIQKNYIEKQKNQKN